MLIVTRKTLDEIFFLKDEYYKETAEDVFGGKLSEYDDDDEFYSGGEYHIPVSEAERLLDYNECVQYLEDEKLMDEFKHYAIDDYVDECIKNRVQLLITAEEIEFILFDYVREDICSYLEWYWGGRNEN